ncbi:unnamed protein product [Rhizoctonia solani]|uniref:Uncharacterized protein n=1 Tax=Rhizoctonia solani TaxID=456999 RepID=A0A8H3AVM5_9AGAM|nr:unnamed protein product [Rhizoctonia solani]
MAGATPVKTVELKLVSQEPSDPLSYGARLTRSEKPQLSNSNDFRVRGDKLPAFATEVVSGVPDGFVPMATMWSLYQKEATEQDQELVKGRDNNLDTMLLFFLPHF